MEPANKKEPIFRRGLDGVVSADLDEIKELEEGWFVEFKSRAPDSQKLAKSVSSFANAYGGLLVIGAEEDSKTRRLKNFVPMKLELADETKTKIRQAVEAHLQPCPMFFMKSVELPEISPETEERWILLVRIPKGDRAPFLHSNGSVYTRKGDSASPSTLTDLGLLDRLWVEGRGKKEQLKKRIEFLCSQSSPKIPKIELIISVDDYFSGEAEEKRITFSDFKRIASTASGDGAPALFNNIYPLDSSYVARHTQGLPKTSSIIWDYDYVRKLHYIQIPMATHNWQGDNFDKNLIGHDALKTLTTYLSNQQQGSEKIFIVDLTPSLFLMGVVLYMVGSLHQASIGQEVRLLANARASGVRNSAIYIDLPRYGEHLESSGLPFVYREVDFIYPINKPDGWYKIQPLDGLLKMKDSSGAPSKLDITNSALIFILITEALGISNIITIGAERHEISDIEFDSFIETCNYLLRRQLTFTVAENPDIS